MLYKRSATGIIIGGLVFAMLTTCGEDKQFAEAQNKAYCEAVDLWVQSAHEYGHPDYKGIYDAQCKRETEVSPKFKSKLYR